MSSSGPPAWRSSEGSSSSRRPFSRELLDQLRGPLVGERLGDLLRHDRADALDLLDLLGVGALQLGDRAEVHRQRLGGDVADAGQAEGVEDALERAPPRGVDRRDQVAGRDLAEALELHQLVLVEVVDVADVGDQALLEEAQRLLLAEPVDVHRPLADEVLDVLEGLPGAAGAVRADREDGVLGLHRLGAAGGAFLRRLRLARALLAFLGQRRDDLGDHVAGAHHDHLVADPDVLARQVLLVVEGRGGDGDAADVDRLEHRERAPGGRSCRRSRRRRAASSSPSSAGTSRRSPSAARARRRRAPARAPARRP